MQLVGVRLVVAFGPQERALQLSSLVKPKVSVTGHSRRLFPEAGLVRQQYREAGQAMREALEPVKIMDEAQPKQVGRGMLTQIEGFLAHMATPAPCELLELDGRVAVWPPAEQVEVFGSTRLAVCHRKLKSAMDGWIHRVDDLSKGELEVRFTVEYGTLTSQDPHDRT